MRSSIIFLFILTLGLSFADLPADIPKCYAGEVDCIAKTITQILHRYPKGNPDFGLNAVDDITLKDVVISKADRNSPIQLNFKFNTLHLRGFENITVTRAVGFKADPNKSKYEVYATIPLLKLNGEYETSGKVLLLPISGKGNSELKLTNGKIGIKTKVDAELRNGKQYAKLTKVKSNLSLERLHVNLENLFGQKDLSDAMNAMINANWQGVWAEVQDGVNGAVEDIVKNLMANVLNALSYDDFYRKD